MSTEQQLQILEQKNDALTALNQSKNEMPADDELNSTVAEISHNSGLSPEGQEMITNVLNTAAGLGTMMADIPLKTANFMLDNTVLGDIAKIPITGGMNLINAGKEIFNAFNDMKAEADSSPTTEEASSIEEGSEADNAATANQQNTQENPKVKGLLGVLIALSSKCHQALNKAAEEDPDNTGIKQAQQQLDQVDNGILGVMSQEGVTEELKEQVRANNASENGQYAKEYEEGVANEGQKMLIKEGVSKAIDTVIPGAGEALKQSGLLDKVTDEVMNLSANSQHSPGLGSAPGA